MSDRPHGDDWRRGPDGKWYPPESVPGPEQPGGSPRQRGRITPAFIAITQAAQAGSALLGATAAVALMTADIDVEAATSADTYLEALGFAGTVTSLASLALTTALIMLIVWAFRTYREALALRPAGRRWSPGWAIAAWLIPVGNLFLPKLVVGEIDRITHPDSGAPPLGIRWKESPGMMAAHWWWALHVAGMVLLSIGVITVAEQVDRFTIDEQVYRAGIQALAAGFGMLAASSAIVPFMVGRIAVRLIVRNGGGSAPTSE